MTKGKIDIFGNYLLCGSHLQYLFCIGNIYYLLLVIGQTLFVFYEPKIVLVFPGLELLLGKLSTVMWFILHKIFVGWQIYLYYRSAAALCGNICAFSCLCTAAHVP